MKEELPKATLIFLRRENEIMLAMKKRGFGQGRWNGVGGKVEAGETLEQAAVRECQEEISVTPLQLGQVAVLEFYFPTKKAEQGWNQEVTVYISEKWEGEPTESEEMAPSWFSLNEIPYESMWSDDELWLPKVLDGKTIRAKFHFDDVESIKSYELGEVEF